LVLYEKNISLVFVDRVGLFDELRFKKPESHHAAISFGKGRFQAQLCPEFGPSVTLSNNTKKKDRESVFCIV
jgi:hypothetical protein